MSKPAKRWEYLVEDPRPWNDDDGGSYRLNFDTAETIGRMDELGDDGWELVAVADDTKCVFKRRLPDDNE